MNVSIVGLAGSGKTTLFNAMVRGSVHTAGKREANVATIHVPDPRFDRLVEMYHPKKQNPANVQFTDTPGAGAGEGLGKEFLPHVRAADTLVEVVRCFENPDLAQPAPQPGRDLGTIHSELILTDLQIVETRLEKLRDPRYKSKRTAIEQFEEQAMQKLFECLEAERPASMADLTEEERKAIRSIELVTGAPRLVVLNVTEESLAQPDECARAAGRACQEGHLESLALSARVEAEISQMEKDDEAEFLKEMGLDEPARARLIRKVYDLLGLMSFFTVGPDEVRAWTIHKGDNAVEAAGKIHSDLARGFIRAEVFHYDDLMAAGSEDAVKAKGLLRLERKEYIVQDGDILHVRFKV